METQKNSSNTIPDRTTCFQLMESYQMLPHIREHCAVVCTVALALANELNKNGEQLNLHEIEAAALLHDITKTNSIRSRENHADTGAHLLRSLGYERIAQIVNAHISVSVMDANGRVTEEEVVNYADKRVQHSTVVSLDQRFEDLMQRYGRRRESQHYILLQKIKTRTLEDKIFSRIPGSPAHLPELIAPG
jgi:putative nucleotidyltransferase with HDIG domain